MSLPYSPLALVALACAAIAATLLAAYLVLRPPLMGSTKVWLLLALGVFPIGAAFAGNVQGYEATTQRTFCGSCHVMTAHQRDSDDLASASLASRHARNPMFGDRNCYVCHADYGMFGTVVTKLGGMRHVWKYYAGGYRSMPLEQAKREIRLVRPYPNANCMQCHSTRDPLWLGVADHRASVADAREGLVSCASAGCHGFAHPFTKSAEELQATGAPRDAGAAADGGLR